MKINRIQKKLILKLNWKSEEKLTRKDILIAYKYLHIHKPDQLHGKKESLENFTSLFFDKKFRHNEKLVDIFNENCTITPWYNWLYCEDGGSMLDKNNPFDGFEIEVKNAEKLNKAMEDFIKTNNKEFVL